MTPKAALRIAEKLGLTNMEKSRLLTWTGGEESSVSAPEDDMQRALVESIATPLCLALVALADCDSVN